jgi:hypothetical protein
VGVQQGDLLHDQVNREAVLEGWGAGPGARFSAIAQVDYIDYYFVHTRG